MRTTEVFKLINKIKIAIIIFTIATIIIVKLLLPSNVVKIEDIVVEYDHYNLQESEPSKPEESIQAYTENLLIATNYRGCEIPAHITTQEHFDQRVEHYISGIRRLNYTDFGAIGDGVENDAEAIRRAHNCANYLLTEHNHQVAVVALNASNIHRIGKLEDGPIHIMTDTDWRGATIFIDDIDMVNGSNVIDTTQPVFRVINQSGHLRPANVSGGNDDGAIRLSSAAQDQIDLREAATRQDGIRDFVLNMASQRDPNKEAIRQELLASDYWFVSVSIPQSRSNGEAGTIWESTVVRRNGSVVSENQFTSVIEQKMNGTPTVRVRPINNRQLVIRNGTIHRRTFNDIGNRLEPNPTLVNRRNISIERSNVTVEHVHYTLDETNHEGITLANQRTNLQGNMYQGGLIQANHVYNLTLKDMEVAAHQRDPLIDTEQNLRFSRGTYAFSFFNISRLTMENIVPACFDGQRRAGENVSQCRDRLLYNSDRDDHHVWAMIGANGVKNWTIRDSELNRVGAHWGTHHLTILDSIIGHFGITATGSGTLEVQRTTIIGNQRMVSLRPDQGSIWNGEIIMRDITWKPRPINGVAGLFNIGNDGTRDFWSEGVFPVVDIDGLTIDTARMSDQADLTFFQISNPNAGFDVTEDQRISPYRFLGDISLDSVTVIGDNLNRFRLTHSNNANNVGSFNLHRNLFSHGNQNRTNLSIPQGLLDDPSRYSTSQFIVTER